MPATKKDIWKKHGGVKRISGYDLKFLRRKMDSLVGRTKPHDRLLNNFSFPSNIYDLYEIKSGGRKYDNITINGNILNDKHTCKLLNNYVKFLKLMSPPLMINYKGFSIKRRELKLGYSYDSDRLRFPNVESCMFHDVCFLEIETNMKNMPNYRSIMADMIKIVKLEKKIIPYMVYMSDMVDLYYGTLEDYHEALDIIKIDNTVEKKLHRLSG